MLIKLCIYIGSDILFESKTGQRSTRLMMGSLGTAQHVMPPVIDSWGEVLNVGERVRSPNSPLRYFMPTFMVVSIID